MKTINVEIEGSVPLLMHNNRLANPLDEASKEHKKVSGKRNKTDEDYEWLAKNEWIMGLYLNDDGDVVLPDVVIEACVIDGARSARLGKQFLSGFVVSNIPKLKNPRTGRYYTLDTIQGDSQFYDTRSVKLKGSSTIMRTRPIFREWSVEFECHYNESVVSYSDLCEAIRVAGTLKGICDYRPKFGKFDVVKIK